MSKNWFIARIVKISIFWRPSWILAYLVIYLWKSNFSIEWSILYYIYMPNLVKKYTLFMKLWEKKDKSYPQIGRFWGFKRCAPNITVGEGGSKIIRSTWFFGCDIKHSHGWTGLMSNVIWKKSLKNETL